MTTVSSKLVKKREKLCFNFWFEMTVKVAMKIKENEKYINFSTIVEYQTFKSI